jgi:CheY-like chemotaxis protein
MSGADLFDRLRAFDPRVRILLSSGYSLKGKAKDMMAKGCNGFLQKPFQLATLSRKVREALS